MLKTLDIFIGLSLVMLLVSMIVTVITQAVTTFLNSRGKHLMKGISDMLEQLDPGITRKIAEEISTAALTHPLVSNGNGKLGGVIHREELTKLLLELASGNPPQALSPEAQGALHEALVKNGICQPGTPEQIQSQVRQRMEGIRAFALRLELTHPELSNAARARMAFLKQAESQFLAKINLWFDQTMDRTSERFTAHCRFVTFFAGLAVAVILQLDTAALVSRLSIDPALRQSLLEIAQKQDAPNAPAGPIRLTDIDQQNLKDVMVNNLVGMPQSFSDWTGRWHRDNFVMKSAGIFLTALLLSLGAPFWYSALQNLLRMRSLLASKDDEQRQSRQSPAPPPDDPPDVAAAASS